MKKYIQKNYTNLSKLVGRQWIDDQIRQNNGVVTTLTEVCTAYNSDHPEAQLTQINVNIFNIVSYELP